MTTPPTHGPWLPPGDHWAPPLACGPPRPPRPPWTAKLWEPDTKSTASPVVLPAALATGFLAALILRMENVGSAFLVTGAGVLAVGFLARGRRPAAWELTLGLLAIALAGVGTVRAAPWLVALSLAGAVALGTLALVSARTWTGVVVGAVAGALAPSRTAAWFRRTLAARPLPYRDRWQLALLVTAISTALLVVFGALFVAADPAFGEMLGRITPGADVPAVLRRIVIGSAVAGAGLLAAFLAQRPPTTDTLAPGAPVRTARSWALAVPLVLLNVLFAAFVLVQLTVLFGGREHVLETEGLTFAEYARQGFWQLTAVTVLTLAVVATAVRTARRSTATERALIRALLGPLCGLALVVVASALHRMSLYEKEFGFTRLRVAATTVELFLGAVLVLLLIAGLRMSGTWLPRAVIAAAAVALLSLAAINPDAYIAERNVDRFERTGRIDMEYLATLSADAVPALLRLPADFRDCALDGIDGHLQKSSDPWFDTNTSRNRARSLLAGAGLSSCAADRPSLFGG